MKRAKTLIIVAAVVIGAFDVGRAYEKLTIAKAFMNQTESN